MRSIDEYVALKKVSEMMDRFDDSMTTLGNLDKLFEIDARVLVRHIKGDLKTTDELNEWKTKVREAVMAHTICMVEDVVEAVDVFKSVKGTGTQPKL